MIKLNEAIPNSFTQQCIAKRAAPKEGVLTKYSIIKLEKAVPNLPQENVTKGIVPKEGVCTKDIL